MSEVIRLLLVTGPDPNLKLFQDAVIFRLNLLDRREQTVRYTALPEDLHAAHLAAIESRVTLQEAVTSSGESPANYELTNHGACVRIREGIEEYRMVHEAWHRMKWEAKSV